MRKYSSTIIYVLFLLLLCAGNSNAQVSHGGKPLPLSLLRNSNPKMYVEMPPFDLEETLRLDSLNESDMRSGFHFAYKFMTEFNRYNSGITFTQPDGTKVWRLGIYSPKALSLNIMFTKYKIPEGAEVFVYNADQTQILGSFNHLNNSDLNVLPIAPIDGDRMIVEYQEPSDVAFPGELTVGEVNHGYRSLRRNEPNENISSISKIPALACYNEQNENYKEYGRSVVLLIIDGTTGCSGTLINNAENDGKPYLLTASHCLNDLFRIDNPDYVKIASSIVCFYNYDSPFCSPIIRGTEEMTTASSYFKAVNEKADMALLELTETPPIYYRPYYAGWSIQEKQSASFSCIQHPQFSTKRISISDRELDTSTFTDPNMTFYPSGHWWVKRWDIGYTAAGSSGSPLFNAEGKVIGALSGGQSYAHSPVNDFYYKLKSAWEPSEFSEEPTKQLKHWLNPMNRSIETCAGLDPYQTSPCFRLSNVYASGKQGCAEYALYPGSKGDFLFGYNTGKATEYAEAYHVPEEVTLYGTYIVTPPSGEKYKNLDVEITVYAGDSKPSTLLYKETFCPKYLHQSVINQSFIESEKSLNRSQESFIPFTEPIKVNGSFFVGYRFKSIPNETNFAAYNLPKGSSSKNTAWIYKENKWMQANELTSIGFNTSLFIDPVIKYNSTVGNEIIEKENPVLIQQGTQRGIVHIIMPSNKSNATFQLYSLQGKMIKNGTIKGQQTTLRFLDIETGVYALRINWRDNHYTQKIIF